MNYSMASRENRFDDSLMSNSQRRSTILIRDFLFVLVAILNSIGMMVCAQDSSAYSDSSAIKSINELQQLALKVAAEAFVESPELPKAWSELTYDEFRKVVFDPNKAIWRKEGAPFFLEAFHRGFVHRDRVMLHSIENGLVKPIPFDTALFDYRGVLSGKDLKSNFGFAGYRVVGKFPGKSDWQEMLTLLGASYFRARTDTGVYGASARGLAIDVGLSRAEEFPVFRSYWVEKPADGSTKVSFFALMDSPSVVGAYQFIFAPGTDRTVVDVNATLYFRRIPERVGVAPLTSMWMWGDGLAGPKEDSRPEVHDSDSLLIHSRAPDQSDRWTCRSLMRQNYPSIVQLSQTDLVGFGLVQRDTLQDHYKDNEAKYHLRPSLWVEPTTNWGEGAIHLLELPAEHEGIDNIAVWWTPKQPIALLTAVPLSYRVTFASGDPTDHSLLKVVAHRIQRPSGDNKVFEIGLDFALIGKIVDVQDRSKVKAVVSGVRCDIEHSKSQRNEDGSWTTTLRVLPTTVADPFELNVQLFNDGRPMSEAWGYLCPIQPPPVVLPPWRQKP